jgi:hypothetical protein
MYKFVIAFRTKQENRNDLRKAALSDRISIVGASNIEIMLNC